MKAAVKKPPQHQLQNRRCVNPVCDAYPCFGKKHGDAFSWACGDHRPQLELPPLPASDYIAPQGRLI